MRTGSARGEIAKQLNISRSYVSKLLTMAKEENIVTVTIKDPLQVESRFEQEIRSYFQLRRVIITPSKVGENSLASLCDTAAKYLDMIIKSGDSIVTCWGRTMYVLSQRVFNRSDLEGLRVICAAGMPTNFNQNTYCIESTVNMAEALGGVPYFLPAPVMIRDEAAREAFLREQSIKEVMEYAEEANIAVFTLGDMNRSSFWTNAGAVTEEEMQELYEKGATGDAFLHILNRSGAICDEELDRQIISIPFKKLKQKEYRIGVAAGREKIDAVYSALKGGVVNVLIIDEDIAKAVLEKMSGAARSLEGERMAEDMIFRGNELGRYCRWNGELVGRRASACYANSPVCDLPAHFDERNDIPRTLVNAFAGGAGDLMTELKGHSPLYQAENLPDIPYMIVAGDQDRQVDKKIHSDRFVERLRRLGRRVRYEELPDMKHWQITDYGVYREYVEFICEV